MRTPKVTGIAGDHPVDSGAFSCAKSLIHSGVTVANIRRFRAGADVGANLDSRRLNPLQVVLGRAQLQQASDRSCQADKRTTRPRKSDDLESNPTALPANEETLFTLLWVVRQRPVGEPPTIWLVHQVNHPTWSDYEAERRELELQCEREIGGHWLRRGVNADTGRPLCRPPPKRLSGPLEAPRRVHAEIDFPPVVPVSGW